jgi:excisionase family DNA binding protein
MDPVPSRFAVPRLRTGTQNQKPPHLQGDVPKCPQTSQDVLQDVPRCGRDVPAIRAISPDMRTQQTPIDEGRRPAFEPPGSEEPLPTDSAHAGRLLAAEEVAQLLGVNTTFVYALVRRGELPAVRIGERYVRFRLQSLERWIEERETSGLRASR